MTLLFAHSSYQRFLAPASRAPGRPVPGRRTMTSAASTMPDTKNQAPVESQTAFVTTGSQLYQEFLAEREEILRHKWLESERLGYDIGFERALLDWIRKHREAWRRSRRPSPGAGAAPAGTMTRQNTEGDLLSRSPSHDS